MRRGPKVFSKTKIGINYFGKVAREIARVLFVDIVIDEIIATGNLLVIFLLVGRGRAESTRWS